MGDQLRAWASLIVPPVSGATCTAAKPASARPAAATAGTTSRGSEGAPSGGGGKRVAAGKLSSWSVPNAGMSQNAVAKVPAIDPAVEIANNRPAVWPSVAREIAHSRTAIGATAARTTLGG